MIIQTVTLISLHSIVTFIHWPGLTSPTDPFNVEKIDKQFSTLTWNKPISPGRSNREIIHLEIIPNMFDIKNFPGISDPAGGECGD